MTLTLKVGKRYVRRDGKVTDPIIVNQYETRASFPFMDPNTRTTFTTTGKFWLAELSDADLISEHKPAKPEWRVVIKRDNRNNARFLAESLKEQFPMAKITVEKSS